MPSDPDLHVVLYNPEIPQNTGNVGRLCVATDLRMHVVHPIVFSMDERAVRRAGLDYWKHVDLQEHADPAAFWAWAAGRRFHLFSSHGAEPYTKCAWERGDVLIFGQETVGLPKDLVAKHGAWRIPMTGPTRSLNMANAVGIVVYQALQSVRPAMFY